MRFTALIFLVIIASSSPATGGGGTVATHWQRPVKVHPSLTSKALSPKSCGQCHIEKLGEWSGSLHGRSMGPGLLFQLDPLTDPETARACYFCHAPLSAQSEVIIDKGKALREGVFVLNNKYDESLKLTGVSCAVCHARGEVVAGPVAPLLNGLKKGAGTGHKTRREGFFEEAEFCAACHQLKEGFRLNGRLLVNTFTEWKESAFGRAGIVCQSCHMPGRRHLFRGIHDAEMARSGIAVELSGVKKKEATAARLTITNNGTGHYYPTYATPLIVVKGFLTDNAGSPLKGTVRVKYIGRRLALDLSEEIFDTRIAPLKTFVFDYPLKKTAGAKSVVFTAVVYPDEFYKRFYEYYLTQETTGKIKKQIEEAHKNSSTSDYILFKKELPLSDIFN